MKSAMFVVMVFFTSKKLIIIFRILHLSEIHLLPLKALLFHHSGKQLNIIIHVHLECDRGVCHCDRCYLCTYDNYFCQCDRWISCR